MLVSAIVLITAALVFYPLGVWAEHRIGSLRWWHVGAFGAGLTFDIAGTAVMARIAATQPPPPPGLSAVLQTIMSTTGLIALILMAAHLLWAILVMVRDRSRRACPVPSLQRRGMGDLADPLLLRDGRFDGRLSAPRGE